MSAETKNKRLQVTLRPMSEDDLSVIEELERRCFSDPWPRAAFLDVLKGDFWTALIAEWESKIVGYSCHFEAAGEAHLANVAVAPEHRRKSVAKQLLNRILDLTRAHGCSQIFLEVRPSNESACRFYLDAGFEELYRRPGYYRSPVEDALVMRFRFDENTDDE